MNAATFNQLVCTVVGALAGAFITFVVIRLLSARQSRSAQEEAAKEKARGIVTDALKFFFKTNDVLNDLWVDKEVWAKFQKESPDKAFEIEQRMFRRFDDSTRQDFFNELMFYSFRLRLLGDQALADNFEELMNTFKELSKQVLIAKSAQEYAELDKKYKNLKKRFLEKCSKLQ